jgi:branched-chain amino acid transport system ATP-binding protein
MDENIITVANLNVKYGAIKAVRDLSFTVRNGEIFAVLGANAAGKTSTLSCISGLIKPESGSILYKGQELAGMPSHKIAALGISHVPEGREVFPDLTVEENLEMGAYITWNKTIIKRGIEQAYTLFPLLAERRRNMASTLSGGEQQMLAIGRGLMKEPELLLLDEPSMGLAPKVIALIFEVVKRVNKSGVTIIIVEQNAKASLKIANHALVIERGKQVLQGSGEELLHDPQIQAAYLGA